LSGGAFAVEAAEGEHGDVHAATSEVLPTHDHLPAHAEEVFALFRAEGETEGGLVVTNSMIMVWVVAALLIIVAQVATKDLKLVPSGVQNFVEWLVESLFGFFEGILGHKLAARTFWFLGTIFILILFSNWFGLIPGIGTVGWELTGADVDPHDRYRPFFRGANADLNLTSAMALTFALMWFYWAFTEIGAKNFFAHIFAPKGEFKGIVLVLMGAIFLFVGAIEVLSIAVRPVALMFRLYGNIYAGESILETMSVMNVPVYLKWLPPLPFYFLELLVGFVQALVFALLCAVFIKLMCEHEHEEHDEHHGDEAHGGKPAPETT
jgi:F-type H+-transporting ATPase subunit a